MYSGPGRVPRSDVPLHYPLWDLAQPVGKKKKKTTPVPEAGCTVAIINPAVLLK